MTGPLVRRVLESPIGPLTLVATSNGLRSIHFPDDPSSREVTEPAGTAAPVDGDRSAEDRAVVEVVGASAATLHLDRAAVQLAEYFAGERTTFDLQLDPVGTPFQLAAWEALRTIPFGSTISYGTQAERMGDRRKARAVGAANGRNPIPIVVPCHRVVGADGSLTGFAGGLDAKHWLLAHESSAPSLAFS